MDLSTPHLVLIAAGAVAVLGAVLGAVTPASPMACTEMGCLPPENGTGNVSVPCNSCFSTEPVFVTGVLDVVKRCAAQEVLTFRDGEQVDRRIEPRACRLDVELLGGVLGGGGRSVSNR